MFPTISKSMIMVNSDSTRKTRSIHQTCKIYLQTPATIPKPKKDRRLIAQSLRVPTLESRRSMSNSIRAEAFTPSAELANDSSRLNQRKVTRVRCKFPTLMRDRSRAWSKLARETQTFRLTLSRTCCKSVSSSASTK